MVQCDVKDCETHASIKHAGNVLCSACYLEIRGWILKNGQHVAEFIKANPNLVKKHL